MNAAKHTPAPWQVSHGGHGSPAGFVIDEYFVLSRSVADDVAIAADIVDPATGIPSEANARLIAAAPELLDALVEATACGMVPISSAKEGGASTHSRQVRCADMIRAAIAKATGGGA